MLINGNLILGSTILKRTGTKATVTYNLTNCVSTNTAVNVSKNGTYTTTLVADTSFSYVGARIIMGTKDITATCYNMSTGIVNITNIEGNITITAEKLTTFSNASWYAIKNVAQNNFASTIGWVIGDTKSLIIGDYSYTVRICDLTEHRYQYYNDTTRYSNMVLETVELYSKQVRDTEYNSNYNNTTLKRYYSDTVYPALSTELQELIETLIIPSNYYTSFEGSPTSTTTNAKIYSPDTSEISGATTLLPQFQLYAEDSSKAAKQLINTSVYIFWWSRTGGYGNNGTYEKLGTGSYVTETGSTVSFSSWQSGNDYGNTRNNHSYGVPIFWAW